MWNRANSVMLVVTLAALALAAWSWLPTPIDVSTPVPEETAPRPDLLTLRAASWKELPGWADDAHAEVLPALRRTCRILLLRDDDRTLGKGDAARLGGTVGEWKPLCRAAAALADDDHAGARALFEAELVPIGVGNHDETEGLFTGYYEASLDGSRRRSERYSVPLYRRPSELVQVELGQFRDDLRGRRIAGRLIDGRLRPYASRAEIDAGALDGRGMELVWVDDPVDAFFLHIQGSGRVSLDDGTSLRVGYAAANGHPYTAIGRELIARGAIPREEVSMQSIRAWLAAHPAEAPEVLALNASYIFFDELDGDGPKGSFGVALTPERSLATDRRYVPLAAPVWLDASAPSIDPTEPDRTWRRLMVAQDTGGAIRGPVRGDVFWGHGDAAAAVAGRMKHSGRLWTLVPRAVAERALAEPAPSDG